MNREVRRIVNARLHRSATGIVGRRAFPIAELDPPSPFVLLEEIGPTHGEPGDAESGSRERQEGVHVVTCLLEGATQYTFSTGEHGLLGPGDVLWSVAGGPRAYSETVCPGAGRHPQRIHGLRFKVALPGQGAGSDPAATRVPAEQIPWLLFGAARARVLAGEAFGTRAAVQPGAGVQAQDWLLGTDADVIVPLPAHLEAMIYVCSETASVGEEGLGVRPGQLALLAPGGAIRLRRAATTAKSLRLLLLAGPHHPRAAAKDSEPVMEGGPPRI